MLYNRGGAWDDISRCNALLMYLAQLRLRQILRDLEISENQAKIRVKQEHN